MLTNPGEISQSQRAQLVVFSFLSGRQREAIDNLLGLGLWL